MTPEEERLFGKAWQDWRGSLSRDDLEGDPRELVYAAFQKAWSAGLDAIKGSESYVMLARRNERLLDQLAESREREAALREALVWYADDDHYSIEKPRVLESNNPERIPPVVWDATDAVFDSGQRARAALAAEQPAAQRAAEGEGVWRR